MLIGILQNILARFIECTRIHSAHTTHTCTYTHTHTLLPQICDSWFPLSLKFCCQMPFQVLFHKYTETHPYTHLIMLILCLVSIAFISAQKHLSIWTWIDHSPSDPPYQVIIVIITIFLYVREQAHRSRVTGLGSHSRWGQRWGGPVSPTAPPERETDRHLRKAQPRSPTMVDKSPSPGTPDRPVLKTVLPMQGV